MTSFKRRSLRWYLIIKRFLASNPKSRLPKKLTDTQKTAIQIILKIIHRPETKLYTDIKTGDKFIKSEDLQLFVFMETNNIKIINSIYGYDVHISSDIENYLHDKFQSELTKRRQAFKEEALSRIEHSLENTLKKIEEHDNSSRIS